MATMNPGVRTLSCQLCKTCGQLGGVAASDGQRQGGPGALPDWVVSVTFGEDPGPELLEKVTSVHPKRWAIIRRRAPSASHSTLRTSTALTSLNAIAADLPVFGRRQG
jgi:hypothetical protein